MRPRSLLIGCIGLALAIAAYTVLAPDALPRLREERRDNEQLSQDVERQRAHNASLAKEVEALQDEGPRGRAATEKAARTELGYIKKDEVIVVVPAAGAPADAKGAQ